LSRVWDKLFYFDINFFFDYTLPIFLKGREKIMGEEKKSDKPDFKIKNIIGIMSGKGGVGKSSVTYLMALALKLEGYSVGIMDADITGASIPELLHLKRSSIQVLGNYILPFDTNQGFRVLSMNLLLENEEQPVIWRGPLLSKAVEQFWNDTIWGDLDFLLVDMPPGTSDIALTVMQSIPLSGLIIVTIPNKLVLTIVGKAINMAKAVNVPVWGLIENMSYVVCPKCGEKINFFGESTNLKERTGVEILASIPMLKEIADIPEKGVSLSDKEITEVLGSLSKAILARAKL
jgi:Mrp family chromosome partitioning ATPase